MRLKLFLILSFLWVASSAQAVITVCASGCNDTNINNARATATATPNSVINVTDNSITNEQDSITGVNTSLTIQSVPVGNLWGSTGSAVVNATTTNSSGAVSIKNFFFSNIGTGANKILNAAPTSTGSFYFGGNSVTFSGDSSANAKLLCNSVLTSANQIVFENDKIFGNASGGILINFNALDVTADSGIVRNCLLVGKTGMNAIGTQTSTSTNNIVDVYNCTIANFNNGILVQNGGAISMKNCLLLGNSLDINLVTESATEFIYCGFGQLPSGAGTSCIYGLTASRELCDQTNFWLSPASQTRGNGVSINGITGSAVGLNGIQHGYSGQEDIGCNPYSAALCPEIGAGK